jgi:hypothetical protein
MPTKRSPLTTGVGVAVITLGVVGAVFIALHILFVVVAARSGRVLNTPAGSTAFFAERIGSLVAKVGLIAAGILILRRSRLAWVVLACVLVLAVADSVVTFTWLMSPIPHGLRPAGHLGRIVGRVVGLMLPPSLYLGALAYLLLPGTRREFAHDGVGLTAV